MSLYFLRLMSWRCYFLTKKPQLLRFKRKSFYFLFLFNSSTSSVRTSLFSSKIPFNFSSKSPSLSNSWGKYKSLLPPFNLVVFPMRVLFDFGFWLGVLMDRCFSLMRSLSAWILIEISSGILFFFWLRDKLELIGSDDSPEAEEMDWSWGEDFDW